MRCKEHITTSNFLNNFGAGKQNKNTVEQDHSSNLKFN